MPALHALDFLEKQPAETVPAVCALFGDEPFLKSLVIARLPPAPAYTPCATLKTAGTQSISIADGLASNVTGSEAPITVIPAARV